MTESFAVETESFSVSTFSVFKTTSASCVYMYTYTPYTLRPTPIYPPLHPTHSAPYILPYVLLLQHHQRQLLLCVYITLCTPYTLHPCTPSTIHPTPIYLPLTHFAPYIL